MSKMDFRSAFALLALVGLAACGDAAEAPEETVEETRPAVEYEGEPAPVNPGVTEGAIMMDTTTVPAPADSAF